jgi:DNA-binding beta-propeller fold protein YncE
VAFLPDGTFFVADGYGNARVVKFDKNGKYLTAWGTKGTGPGQFNLVHCVAVDARRRVYVADRNNSRIQLFDENGTFVEEWKDIMFPSHLIVTSDQSLWVLSAQAKRFAKYDLKGTLLTYWGSTPHTFPGGMATPHQFSVDAEGNVYIADYTNPAGVQKFVPKKNADRSRLIGQPLK